MKSASRPTQLALFSNLSNECRRAVEGGGAVRRLAEETQRVERIVGIRLALYCHGTCRCRCSTFKGFHRSKWEVTRTSFAVVTHLCCYVQGAGLTCGRLRDTWERARHRQLKSLNESCQGFGENANDSDLKSTKV